MNTQHILRPPPTVAQLLADARKLAGEGQAVSAELMLRKLVETYPDVVEAWLLLADLAEQRGDEARARDCLAQAQATAPQNDALPLGIATKQLRSGRPADAVETLAALLARQPGNVIAWVMLGDIFDAVGMPERAASARYQAVQRGQAVGMLMNMETTPEPLRPVIHELIASINTAQQDRIGYALASMREQLGASEIKRVEHAMSVYLEHLSDPPRSPHQKPKFLFFPGLPEGPYHDPYLHPWASKLDDAYATIRAEAQGMLRQEEGMEQFLSFKPGQSTAGYLGGDGRNPSWDAFFFYRHGKRNDANHLRAPATSAVLNSIELCEVAGQAPEICFSVLQPGTHIMKHHGVTNTRLVMHLPLIVPSDCALNVMGGGEHAWKEGKLMMFDDTFEHEAWNRSEQTRVILLMDCWNPHLTPAERIASRHLIETISAYENLDVGDLAQIARQIRGEPAPV